MTKAHMHPVLVLLALGAHAMLAAQTDRSAQGAAADLAFGPSISDICINDGLGAAMGAAHDVNFDEIDGLQKAAEKGDAAAQYELGMRYKDGDRVKESRATSNMWFRK